MKKMFLLGLFSFIPFVHAQTTSEVCEAIAELKNSSNKILVIIDTSKEVKSAIFKINTNKTLGQIFSDDSKKKGDKIDKEFITNENDISYDYIQFAGSDLNQDGKVDQNESKSNRFITMLEGTRQMEKVSYTEIGVGKDGLPDFKNYEDKSGYWALYQFKNNKWEFLEENGMDFTKVSSGQIYEFIYPNDRKPNSVSCN